MKHLKKLSVVLMITTLFSTSFTSCIDNEVSPIVEAIYEAQADLIAAQTAVQNAEAAYKQAEAEYKLALAASENADAAYTMEQVAQLKISNDEALLVYQENQALLNIELAKLALQLDEVGANVALGYALNYRTYANAANALLNEKADAQYDLTEAQALINSNLPLYVQTQLETVVENAKFQIELHEAEIAILQALLDDPNSLPAQKTAWENRKAELTNLVAAKKAAVDMKKEEAYNIVAGLDGEDGVRDNFITLFEKYKDQADDTFTGANNWAKQIKDFQTIIDNAQDAIDDYATALANAQTAIDDAQTDVDNAEAALGMDVAYNGYYTEDADGDAIAVGGAKYATPANLQEVLVNATIDKEDADAEYTKITGEIAALYGELNVAINALASAQGTYDSGISTVTGNVTAAGTALTTAQGALATAKSYYEAKQTIFEAAPAGSTWFDLTTPLGNTSGVTEAYTNTRIGNHADILPNSFVLVTSWVETATGSGIWTPLTLAATSLPALPAATTEYTVSVNTGGGAPATPYYVEVEADDMSETNAALLADAVEALGDNDIYDDAPALPTTWTTTSDVTTLYLTGTDAYTVVYNAELDLLHAEFVEANFGTALEEAQEYYDYQKNLYDNELTILDGVQAAQIAADEAYDDAKEAVDNAWDELGADLAEGVAGNTKITVVAPATLTLNEVLFNAEVTLADLEACDEDCLQETIDNAQHQIDLIQPSLDFVNAKIAEMQDQYDLYMETYVLGASTSYANLDADLKVKYDTLMHEAFVLQQELDALDAELDYINDMLSNTSGIDNLSEVSLEILTILYDNSQGSYKDALADLKTAEEALAKHKADMADDATYIQYLQAKVDTLQQRYENAAALAAKYLALMNAAIAS